MVCGVWCVVCGVWCVVCRMWVWGVGCGCGVWGMGYGSIGFGPARGWEWLATACIQRTEQLESIAQVARDKHIIRRASGELRGGQCRLNRQLARSPQGELGHVTIGGCPSGSEMALCEAREGRDDEEAEDRYHKT